ncbi:MAG TPA: hypothetical protein PKI32_05055 [Opitutales bacterium]|nr:hypothetical protein [Opitutales bacterium]
MKKRNLTSRELDSRIDELLSRRSASASASFAADTIARIHRMPEVSDDALDAMLSARPVAPAADFTRRTVALARRENKIIYFFRPMLAAAASIAVCLTGIWAYEGPAVMQMANAPHDDYAEIVALASALDGAAPLLDGNNAETLTCLIDGK